MERYPKIAKLINNVDIENYPAYKECVKCVAEITALDENNIPFIWEEMLYAVLKSCNIKVIYNTKQAVSNWIEAAFMWNANVYAPLAREGYFPFPVSGDYYDFGFSRELGYLDSVTNPYLRRYILAIALFEILRYYIEEEMPKPLDGVWKGLIKKELSFEERDMWEIILGNWPVQIDWNYYDLQFDGKNFALLANNQSRLKEHVFPTMPIQNSYKVMDRVYAGEYPRDIDDRKSIEKIKQFERFGITHLIDLTEEGELHPYSQLLDSRMQHIRFPIKDVSIPATIESVKELIGQIHGILNENDGNKVYIHCWGGVGRTGTIVGCLLSHQHDFDYEQTMNALKKAFSDCPKSAYRQTPETREQCDFIARYTAEMKQEEPGCQVQDRIRGSLIGGAIGDALGYPVEFMSRKAILRKYGDRGVHKYVEFDRNGKAVVSDDTQMTLFTANGLLFGVTRFCTHGILGAGLKDYVAYAYQDWLQTQIGVEDYNAYHYCWIRDIVELNVQRAPGNTCMSALMSMKHHQRVDNDSKGCGGVMRVAPVGMMAAADEQVVVKDWYGKEVPRREWQTSEILRLGGDCAEITHKHPLGYLPAAFMADLIYYILMHDETITFSVFEGFLRAVYADVKREYTTEREQQALDELWILIEKAINQAGDITVSDDYAIPRLGEGWTGDEALAIAIYCAMKHLDNFEDALAAAVNHDGDSDSTGAICGNLMGAIIGYNAIPEHFKQKLELRNLLLDMADDIVRGCPISEYHAPETPDERQWERRYVKIEPVGPKHFKGVFSFLNSEYHIMPQAQKTATARSD